MLRLLLFLTALLLVAPAPAAASEKPLDIDVALLAETDSPAPGEAVTLAFSFTPKPGWHGYWLNPGDAGLPARAEWQLPLGAEVEPLRFPVPKTLVISGLMNYVYEGPHAVLTRLACRPASRRARRCRSGSGSITSPAPTRSASRSAPTWRWI
jgi:DsbC/DsbD-like thiol-disulfide interchange protein